MQFSSDCSFHIGAQHLRSGMPCQDYAISGVTNDSRAYAVVCDGCSSGGRTDVGARIMALNFQFKILQGYEGYHNTPDVVANRLGLGTSDLLSTRLSAVAGRWGCQVKTDGDGVVAFVFEDGSARMVKLEWANNTPWYPAYSFRREEEDAFVAAHANSAPAFIAETWDQGTDGLLKCSGHVQHKATTEFLKNSFVVHPGQMPYKYIAVFSDGVFQVKDTEWQAVVLDLLAFRSTVGDFVKRRMNRFLRDHEPVDDISMACIMVEP